MAENLMCSAQKANSNKFNKEYSRIFADKDLKEVAVIEASISAKKNINATEIKKKGDNKCHYHS